MHVDVEQFRQVQRRKQRAYDCLRLRPPLKASTPCNRGIDGLQGTRQCCCRCNIDPHVFACGQAHRRPIKRTARFPWASWSAFSRREGFSAPVWYGNRTRNSQIYCLVLYPVELTTNRRSLRHNPCAEHTMPTERSKQSAPLAQLRQRCLKSRSRDAGGSRTHFKLLCRQLPCRLAPASINKRCPRQESNLVFDLRRVACDPPHSENVGQLFQADVSGWKARPTRADDWIRTSIIRFTRPAPFCFEPRRQSQESGVSRAISLAQSHTDS
jgi:hypothetical protein